MKEFIGYRCKQGEQYYDSNGIIRIAEKNETAFVEINCLSDDQIAKDFNNMLTDSLKYNITVRKKRNADKTITYTFFDSDYRHPVLKFILPNNYKKGTL